MKWLRKFRISCALDNGRSRRDLQTLAAESPELHAFAQDITGLDSSLHVRKPQVKAPPFLHHTIMAAVRAAAQPAAPKSQTRHLWRPAVVVAVAILVFAGLLASVRLWMPRFSPESPSGVLQRQVAVLPGSALSPLSDELQRLDRDLRRTAEFLIASMPGVGD